MHEKTKESFRSDRLIDPALRTIVANFPPFILDAQTLPAMRQMITERYGSATDLRGDAVRVESIEVPRPGCGGAIRVVSYRPCDKQGPLPVVLHMHGGGFVMGVPEMNDAQHRVLAADCGVAVYSVDYRLAPETAYPGALDDGYAVLEWLRDNAQTLNIDIDRIGVKGESAGGGLAAALALRARDSNGPALAFQLLTFPALDDRTGSEADAHPYCGEFLWTGPLNRFAWQSMLGCTPGGADTPAYAAPARAEALANLPPAFIAVGALDLYLEEDLEYARRLARVGVPVELHVYPGAVHGFSLAPGSWIDTTSERDLKSALCRFIGF